MTLTGRLITSDALRLTAAAAAFFAAELHNPVAIDGITLFEEPAAGAPFLAIRHFPFSHSSAEAAA